ncbi:hypothetical protein D3OALGA1CA_5571 [Olavius algarvensis associated proteobacterium Delta 3]|nr:hypothetical protein D3OALGB2SA_5416 [Olavius algarvensis associated proteobacterium Delta 3]CAB5168673.1 hypothetical protein D3OALGA1CA_5571 [Olavius algarvensis associated proteobacterium Delta 3]
MLWRLLDVMLECAFMALIVIIAVLGTLAFGL